MQGANSRIKINSQFLKSKKPENFAGLSPKHTKTFKVFQLLEHPSDNARYF